MTAYSGDRPSLGAYEKPNGKSTAARLALIIGIATGYMLAYRPLEDIPGGGAGIFVIAPVLTAAWIYGKSGGLVAGVLAFPVNLLLVVTVSDFGLTQWIDSGTAVGLAVLVVGGAVGWLRSLTVQLQAELERRRDAEGALISNRQFIDQMAHATPAMIYV